MAQRDFYAKDNRRQQLLIKSLHTELGEEDAEIVNCAAFDASARSASRSAKSACSNHNPTCEDSLRYKLC